MIHVASLESWCHNRWKGPIYFYKLSRYFAHDIQYIIARLKVELRHTKHLHQDICIPNTENTRLLMNHRSMTNEKYSSTFYRFCDLFCIIYTALKMGHLPRSGIRNWQTQNINTWIVAVQTHDLFIPQVRPAHKYPNSPWEMIYPPGGDNAVCM
jgi:hypothetical protein